jgi:hypothetical protein
MEKTLHDKGIGNGFLNRILVAQEKNSKNGHWLHQIIQASAQHWKQKILANYSFDKRLIPSKHTWKLKHQENK